MTLSPFARVRIFADDSLERVADVLSEKLFARVPFGGSELGLFDEVPALRLEGDFLGLFVAVHGEKGEYVLLIQPTPKSLRGKKFLDADISNYLAGLVRSIGLWRVEVPKA